MKTNKEIIKDFRERDILTRTILLNWLRNKTDLYEKGLEERFNEILKDFVVDILEEILEEISTKKGN